MKKFLNNAYNELSDYEIRNVEFVSTGKNPYFTVDMKGVRKSGFLNELHEVIMDMNSAFVLHDLSGDEK